jgi:anthraniloyl-CoA monooxygenase
MRIGVLGGGPAGLYLSLLMKKADPRHEIELVERNAPGATFGWGVVFSEETLGSLRDADHESSLAITDAFARWSAIDVHFGGKVVRSRGHVFSGVARKELLRILQERCREVGVRLSFDEELPDLSRFEGYDLIVAADGVNSTVRRLHEDWFRPTLDVHRSKYVWFGTTRTFDAFTFIFRETEHGLFQVHAYPFDAGLSTFIVECNQATWERAGLEGCTEEESIAFCEELFAPELDGHRLLSNRSLWVSFVTVRCESWHRGNVALLGDAAHTAHFTIGSGTKLAMEDAISLANAFVAHPSDMEAALTEYELERQPVVERFQEAARESARYFEDVIRYTGFEPLQFAFQLLTRSGRITHLELEKRDPAFVAAVDRRFAERATGMGTTARAPRPERTATVPLLTPPPPLFAPLDLAGVRIANRVVLMAETDGDGTLAATVGARLLEEPGLVLTPFVAVSADARVTPDTPVAEELEPFVPGLERAPVCVVLGHAGRRGSTRPRREGLDRPLREGGWDLVSASPIAYGPRSTPPRELHRAAMQRIVAEFAAGATHAARAGAGALLLEASRGYLLASFLSPLANRRDDRFGGAVEHRLRFPLEVLVAVREAWGPGPLGVRLSATDWAPRGLPRSEALEIAHACKEHGADFLDVVAGGTVAEQRPVYGRMFLVPFSDVLRNEVGIPTMTSGNVTTADEVNTILAAGRADLVVLDPRAYERGVVRDGASA